jgi:hypothetical protein
MIRLLALRLWRWQLLRDIDFLRRQMANCAAGLDDQTRTLMQIDTQIGRLKRANRSLPC